MITVQAKIKGLAPIQYSTALKSPKQSGEADSTYEERTWKERAHINTEGHLFIPPIAIKKSLETAARFRSETIPGKKNNTWTKHFSSGTMCVEPLVLTVNGKPLTEANIEKLTLFVPSDGKKGGGRRVYKHFPMVRTWETVANIVLIDPLLVDKRGVDKVEEYLRHAGQLIGLLAFRPENGGYFGRYEVAGFKAVA